MRILSFIVMLIVFLLNVSLISGQSFNPEIISVGVDTLIPNNQGRVKLTWKANQHPDVTGYRAYYIENEQGNKIELPPFFVDDTSYVHEQADANKSSRGYTMASFTNNTSLSPELVDPHFTVFLQSEGFNYCTKTIRLTWSNYIGWGNGLQSYSVYRKKSNEAYQLLATVLAGSDTTFTENSVEYNSIYKYYVLANNSNGTKALSNIVQIITDVEQVVDLTNFYLDSAIYDGSTEYLSFNSIATDLIFHYNIYARESESAAYKYVQSIESNASSRYQFTDNSPGKNGQFYAVSAMGLCNDSLGLTNAIRQVILAGSVSNNVLTLNWNNGFNEGGEYFDVYLQIDGAGAEVYEQISGKNTVEYNLTELSNGNSENFCFFIGANLPKGFYSQSNALCFTITPVVEMATAFSPNGDGLNDYINPEIKYADIKDYEFLIYDKFGQRIFKTESQSFQWDGKSGSKHVKEGAYLYYLNFTTQWGHSYEKSGVINVIYP